MRRRTMSRRKRAILVVLTILSVAAVSATQMRSYFNLLRSIGVMSPLSSVAEVDVPAEVQGNLSIRSVAATNSSSSRILSEEATTFGVDAGLRDGVSIGTTNSENKLKKRLDDARKMLGDGRLAHPKPRDRQNDSKFVSIWSMNRGVIVFY